jgi:thymidylate synthase (FAD)
MGKVTLVATTKPSVMSGIESASELVAYCARVSNPTNQLNNGTSQKLLKYLADNKHWSPFEMVNVVMEIETTRDIARQILRHRSFSFQEFSQRYAAVDNDSFELRGARLQDTKNRQNSIQTGDMALHATWEQYQENAKTACLNAYNWALDKGIAKEVARAVLPEGMTNSRMYMNGTLRSWIHYCELRMGNGTQLEHRLIAKQCWELLIQEFQFLQNLELDI